MAYMLIKEPEEKRCAPLIPIRPSSVMQELFQSHRFTAIPFSRFYDRMGFPTTSDSIEVYVQHPRGVI